MQTSESTIVDTEVHDPVAPGAQDAPAGVLDDEHLAPAADGGDGGADGPPVDWVPWWANQPLLRRIFTIVAVLGTTVFTLVNVRIDKVFRNNTPTGGDMGAHVWAPAFLRDNLLPNLRIQGWSMDWYAGLPVYRFYMLPPALLMVFLNALLHIPYGIAFKFVAILGLGTMPLNAWAFGRLSKLAWPIPEFLAIGAVLFLFDENFSIYGGNVASTMAGEFSFSIALSLALLGFGLLSRGLREGKGLGMAAAILALAAVCHGIVAIFVGLGTVTLMVVWVDRRRWKWSLATFGTFLLLTAWWILPFKLSTHFMTNMKYEPYEGPWWKFFNPQSPLTTTFLIVFALIGFGAGIARRNRAVIFLGISCLSWVVLVVAAERPLPLVGDLFWNYRGLPFFYLLRYLLAVIGIAETVLFIVRSWSLHRAERLAAAPGVDVGVPVAPFGEQRPRRDALVRVWVQSSALVLVGLLSLGWVAFGIDRLPFSRQTYSGGKWYHQWGFIKGPVVNDGVDSDGWASYNFDGYQGRETWNEYRGLLQASKDVGAARGCGRALWEHQSDKYGSYGTPMALMLLPFWTKGCISSMEGLFFEASGTTPYHFLAASAASENASDPVRELRYDKNDIDLAVEYMRNLGVRYYYAFTPAMVEQAAEHPDLTEVAASGPWRIYEIRDWAFVVPLDREPVVVRHRGGDARERWLEVGLSWFQHSDEWKGLLVDDGPKEWQRINVEPDESRAGDRRVHILRTLDEYTERPVEPFIIDPNTVKLGQSSISFEVPQEAIGRPVLVRVSYFPNWDVSGAKGPYRAAPNFMVVVPTKTRVELTYGYSGLDIAGYGLTFVGIGLLGFFWRRRRVDFSGRPDDDSTPEPDQTPDAVDESTVEVPDVVADAPDSGQRAE